MSASLPLFDRAPRNIAEVLRRQGIILEKTRIQHDELGLGEIQSVAADGIHAAVLFDSGQRFTAHLLDLKIVLPVPAPE